MEGSVPRILWPAADWTLRGAGQITGPEESGWERVAAGEVVARSDYSVPPQLPPSLAQWRWPIDKVRTREPAAAQRGWDCRHSTTGTSRSDLRCRAQVKDKIAQKMFNHTSRAADQLRQAFWIFGHENRVRGRTVMPPPPMLTTPLCLCLRACRSPPSRTASASDSASFSRTRRWTSCSAAAVRAPPSGRQVRSGSRSPHTRHRARRHQRGWPHRFLQLCARRPAHGLRRGAVERQAWAGDAGGAAQEEATGQ